MHKQMNQILRKSIYGESHMQTGRPCRYISSQRTCASNFMVLTLNISSEKSDCMHVVWHANGYVKKEKEEEKEKNMTILAIYHGALLATMGYYLWNDIHNSYF